MWYFFLNVPAPQFACLKPLVKGVGTRDRNKLHKLTKKVHWRDEEIKEEKNKTDKEKLKGNNPLKLT